MLNVDMGFKFSLWLARDILYIISGRESFDMMDV